MPDFASAFKNNKTFAVNYQQSLFRWKRLIKIPKSAMKKHNKKGRISNFIIEILPFFFRDINLIL